MFFFTDSHLQTTTEYFVLMCVCVCSQRKQHKLSTFLFGSIESRNLRESCQHLSVVHMSYTHWKIFDTKFFTLFCWRACVCNVTRSTYKGTKFFLVISSLEKCVVFQLGKFQQLERSFLQSCLAGFFISHIILSTIKFSCQRFLRQKNITTRQTRVHPTII